MAEVAGLVLGVIPIIIEGLEVYIRSIKSVKKYLKYADTVSSLARHLAVERTIYRNNCILLLEGLVPDQELALLLEDPGGPLWKDEVLERKLMNALGESFHPYMGILSSMNGIMEGFKKNMGIENGVVKWSDRKRFKSEWEKVVRFLYLQETKHSLSELHIHNSNMRTLMGDQVKMKSPRAKEATKYSNLFANIQDHARTLYRTLQNSFGRQCGCSNVHKVKLRLEARFQESYLSGTSISDYGVGFRVLFHLESPKQASLSSDWKEVVIRPAPGGRAVHNISEIEYTLSSQVTLPILVPPIAFTRPAIKLVAAAFHPEDLASEGDLEFNEFCTTLYTDQFPSRRNGNMHVGVLDDNGNQSRLEIELSDALFVEPSQVSLLELLSIGDSLERREDRLVLGLKLASSTLQLSRTPWISEDWNTEDVLFVKQQNDDVKTMIQNPYISGPFFPNDGIGSIQCIQQVGIGSIFSQVRNRTLFNLGTILLELWFGKASEALRSSQGGDSRFAAACALARKLGDEEGIPGEDYARAVRFCLSLDMGGNKSNSLDTTSFQEEVWSNVVWPLQEYLKSYSRKNIDQLLL